ncbi:hypothetical protein HP456_11275 [Bacillus haikouensis]|uniref:hypothetical protein n=1 Tax=Bacillus haikouensis TaxID=1510468 RepID=UPI0015569955|nr:hypothetical protein [Bacillus haikouensis]NQD66498.1 hypothetical protein [Bacillus haikouensis]
MDDKMFEKRLELLDRSYKKLPPQTDSAAIISAIRKEQSHSRKKRSRPFIHWPYAASFIGVLLIGTILALQLSMGNGSQGEPGQSDPQSSQTGYSNETSEELGAQIEDAKALYELRKTQAMARLGLNESTFSQTQLYKDAQGHLLYVETISKRKYPLDQKLEWVKSGKERIEESLRTPGMMIGSLKGGVKMMEAEVWTEDFLEKQRSLLPLYEEKLNQYKEWWKPHIKKGEINMKDLNAIQHYPPEFRTMLGGITNNAVKLTYNKKEDTLETSIDLEYVNMISNHALPEVYVSYIQTNQSPVLKAGEFTTGWNEAGDRLMLLEEMLKDLPEDSRFRNELKHEYELLYHHFVKGGVNQPIFHEDGKLKPEVREAYEYISEHYSSYKTAESLKKVLHELQKVNYVKPERWIQHTPVIISSEVEMIDENQ